MAYNFIFSIILVLMFTSEGVTSQVCSNPIPGVTQMAKGVDVTKLDLLPLQGVVDQSRMDDVIELTCSGDDAVTVFDDQYQRPKQLINPKKMLGQSISVASIKTAQDLKHSLLNSVTIDSRYNPVAFLDSISYDKTEATLSSKTKEIIDITSFQSAYSIDMVERYLLRFSSDAQSFIENNITTTFAANKEPYLEFIRKYGTHYFASASFGAVIKDRIILDTKYSKTKTDAEIIANANASFYNKLESISSTTSFPKGDKTVSELFTKSSKSSVRYYGGDFGKSNNLEQWQSSTHTDPWLFECKLAPIFTLVRSERVRDDLRKATEYYVLREIRNTLQDMLKTFEKFPIPLFKTLKEKVESMTLDNVVTLVDEIHYHTQIPSWFSSNTQLCYTTKPTATSSGGFHCNKNDHGDVCIPSNARMNALYDNTGPAGNACHMQWSITSKNEPDWFKKTQICFKYGSSGGEMCNGNGHGEYCAPVNQLTKDYIDSTSNVDGYCKMSWTLKTPDDAPLWMQTMSLCFYWSRDTDVNACGNLNNDDNSGGYCVLPGTWTPFYKDNTVGANTVSGCYFDWGWYSAYHDGINVYTSVDDLKERLSKFEEFPSAILHRLQENVNNVTRFSDVSSLVNEVYYHTELPDWFTTKTQMCFSHTPTKGSSTSDIHCGSNSGKECVNPDRRMFAHWEQTGKNNACHMQWGITSQGAPEWFQKTQLCFRYESTGNEKCNGNGKDEVCAPVNEMTKDYIDNTSQVEGYCRMSWRMTTPDNAPMWMKTVRFCFYWSPNSDTDKDTCGDLEQRSYCVQPGTWTPYYKDNTDERQGKGCYLSWGWFTVFH